MLHLASWYGNSQLCVELIRLGVDPNKQDFVRFIQHKETPLHIAAWKGNYKTMKALIEVSDVTMENIVNYKQEGKKAIDLALKNGHSNVVELIEKHLKETIFVYDLL